MQFRGCGTALVTPFRQDGSIDEAALRNLVAWQVESGIDFLVPCGTTGETPTLSHDEWLQVIDITIEVGGGTRADRRRRYFEFDPGCGRTKPKNWRRGPASMASSPPRLITTSRRRKDSTGISAPSPKLWTSRSFSTTFRDARREHRTGHAGAAGRGSEHRGREGSQRQHQPDGRSLQRRAGNIFGVLRATTPSLCL